MQNAIVVLLIAAVLTGSGSARAAEELSLPAAEDGASARTDIIKSIEFEGNVKFKDHVLRQRLGFELGDRLDPFLAEGGRLTIAGVAGPVPGQLRRSCLHVRLKPLARVTDKRSRPGRSLIRLR